MMFLASRGRRQSLERFFGFSRPHLEGRVLIDEDDPSYDGMELPEGWKFFVRPRDKTSAILNRAFLSFPNEPFYGVLCDDMAYSPEGWDEILAEAATPKYVAWGDDGRWGPKLCTSFFIGGDLARAFGWIAHPSFGHLYVDSVWWMIAKGAGIARYRKDVKATHRNVKDKTYLERSIGNDHETFSTVRDQDVPQLTLKAAAL